MKPMETSTHLRIVHSLKILMVAIFGANLLRIVYRTVKYGGSTGTETHTYDFDDGLGKIEGVNEVEGIDA